MTKVKPLFTCRPCYCIVQLNCSLPRIYIICSFDIYCEEILLKGHDIYVAISYLYKCGPLIMPQ